MKNPYSNISTTVWLLATISLINKSGAMVVVFFPLYLTQKLYFDIIVTGLILSIYGLGHVLGSYLGGTLTDKIGFLKVQIFSLFFTGILYLLLEHLHSKYGIIAAMFLIGVISACLRPATVSTIAKYTTSENRMQAYALNYQAINLGSAFGPALGGILASIDYAWLFRVDGVANLIGAAAMWLFFHKSRDATSALDTNPALQITTAWWRNKSFLLFLVLTFLTGLVFLLLLNLYPLYLKEGYYLSDFQIGLVIGFNGLLVILLQMPLATYLKQFNLLHVIAVGGLFLGLGYGILPLYSGFYFALFTMFLITMGEMTTLPQLNNFIVKIAPYELQGKYFGLLNSAFSIPMLLAPSLGAYIYTRFGAQSLWFGVAITGVIIFIGFERLRLSYRHFDMRS